MNPLSVAMFAAGAAGSKAKDARIAELEAALREIIREDMPAPQWRVVERARALAARPRGKS